MSIYPLPERTPKGGPARAGPLSTTF